MSFRRSSRIGKHGERLLQYRGGYDWESRQEDRGIVGVLRSFGEGIGQYNVQNALPYHHIY
eukprot:scaffold75307_cov62-Cyclotella_meneghiniana.AAC.3